MKITDRLSAIFLLLLFLLVIPIFATAQAKPDTLKAMKLWPRDRLTTIANGKKITERETSAPGDPISRITDVTDPTIQVYKPAKPNGTAVIVCPGGGYYILAMNLEGEEICRWLNSFGVTAILLKYRVPTPAGMLNYQLPLQDAQRTMGLVRYNAARWNIKPDHIGILGFSAGGHLSAALSNNYSKRTYVQVDAADTLSCRPDFAVLIYPAYLTDKNDLTKIAPELQVTSQTPPTILIQTEDDPINVENSLVYYLALKKAKVPAEMHLFANGGHGYGMRSKKGDLADYPKLIEKWISDNFTAK